MNDLEGCARELRVALGDPAQLHATPGLFERFLEAYRTSDEPDAQVLDASDAHVIEPGSPPERPAMWSTKKLRADQPHPWVASNGRWIVSQLTDGAWNLERRFGGRWQRATDGSWLCHSDPILTRRLPAFTTQWEALWLALRIDFWDRLHDGDFEHAPDGVVERIQRTGRPDIRYLDEGARLASHARSCCCPRRWCSIRAERHAGGAPDLEAPRASVRGDTGLLNARTRPQALPRKRPTSTDVSIHFQAPAVLHRPRNGGFRLMG
jgi:hypothetical protein